MTEVLSDRSGRNASGLFQAFGMGVVSALFGVVPARAITHPPADVLEWLLVVILAGVSLLAGVTAVKHYFGHERILVGDGHLRVVRNVGPLRRDTSLLLTDITSVEVPYREQAMVMTRWGLRPAVLVRTAAESLRCGDSVSPLEAEEIAERIRSAAHI